MPKPILGNQLAQDTFENLSDQGGDVLQSLKDLVSGANDQKGDSGVELAGGAPTDPAQMAQQAQRQGLTPQQLQEKQQEKMKLIRFHKDQIERWAQESQQLRQEQAQKKQVAEEEEKKKEEQEIVQLQQDEAERVALQSKKPKQGRGTAFLPPSARQGQNVELPKTITN